MNPNNRSTDLSYLYPDFRVAVQKVLLDLQHQGIPLWVFEAFRHPQRQAELYSQGRNGDTRSIVTKAKPWSSFHQYGMAADFVFYINGQWTWKEPQKGLWSKLHEIGQRHGLHHLDFETPHLELAGINLADLQKGIYPQNGDETWAENLNAAIAAWTGEPKAPASVQIGVQPPMPQSANN